MGSVLTSTRPAILFALLLLVQVFHIACGKAGGSNDTHPPVTAPAITTQPQSVTVTAPATATFTVTATGTAPLSYQWRKDGTTISDATFASYTTAATSTSDSGARFSVVVTNSVGSVTTSEATLTVTPVAPPPSWSGVSFPWPVFDGSVPDVPTSSPGATYYCDPILGNDAWDGTRFAFASGTQGPKRTVGNALGQVKAGDTILLGGGVYRERLDFSGITGLSGAPITLGSYGRGTGAPILDGGLKPTWTKYSAQGQTSVWKTDLSKIPPISAQIPVLGIYVHSGTTEMALKEVPHGQLSAYGGDSLPPNQTQSGISDQSGHWFFDPATRILYADFGAALGSGDPNGVDISVLYNSANGPAGHEVLIYLPRGSQELRFIGLTLRGASWTAMYSEASHVTVDHCDVKFNGGGGLFFAAQGDDLTVTDNRVSNCRIWMNVLDNWPRFNNGNTTGGWPGGLSWYSQSNALGQGNAIYQNGGEGLIFWGTDASGATAHVSSSNVARHNVIFDNWSVNLYCDNTQNAFLEQNFVFNHPRDPAMTFDHLLELSPGYDTDWGRRLQPIHLSLGDEPYSSFESPTGHAHLSDITVINNLFAGGGVGFLDYDDGTAGVFHGLKHCFIANNTWLLSGPGLPGQDRYGWRHLFGGGSNPDQSTTSFLLNNIFSLPDSADLFIQAGNPTAGPGITVDYNLYSGPGRWMRNETPFTFAAWRAAIPGWDAHSLNLDAQLLDPAEFSQTYTQKPVYDWRKAAPSPGSKALGAGLNQTSHFTSDFTGASRADTSFDLGALNP